MKTVNRQTTEVQNKKKQEVKEITTEKYKSTKKRHTVNLKGEERKRHIKKSTTESLIEPLLLIVEFGHCRIKLMFELKS